MKAEYNELRKLNQSADQTNFGRNVEPSGQRKGLSVRLIEAKADVDDQILSDRYRSALGLSSNIENIALRQRSLQTEVSSKSFNLEQIKSYGKATGASERITSRAQEILKKLLQNEKPPQAQQNISSLIQQYMSLQLLSRALSGDESQYISLLTPQADISDDLKDLAKKLQNAGDDTEQLSSLLSGISGLPTKEEEQNQLKQMMSTLRFHPDQLEAKLKQAQNLPDLDKSTKEILKEKVQDAIRDLECQHTTTLRGAINSLGAALQTGEVERFQDGYNDVISETTSFSDIFSKLLKHYNLTELVNILPKLKQALAEDLAADNRSIEKIKLESLLSEISYMHISSTLIEMTNKLCTGLERIYHSKNHHPINIDQKKLLLSVTKIISGGWISSLQFEKLSVEHNVPDGGPTIYFLNGLKQILRELPIKVMLDTESRSALIDAAQNAIESAIEKEESAIYGGEN